MSIIPFEFSYLEHEKYCEFNENIYNIVKCTEMCKYQQYLINKYSEYELSYNCSTINNFQYKFNTDKLEFICTDTYEKNKNMFATFIFQDNGFFIDFVDFCDLADNLQKTISRYYPIITAISIPAFNEYHCAIFIIDKKDKKVYLIDSNGDVINYYGNYFDVPEIIGMHFNNCISELFSYINYKYVSAFHNDITKPINYINEELNEKPFFTGYCVAWSIFFCELFLAQNNQYQDITNIMNPVYKMTNYQRNEIINRYHSYLYLNFCTKSDLLVY